nr:short-chain dehydrogenase/reductase SDR [uncultured bacterium]
MSAAWRLLSTAQRLADGPRLWALTRGVLESADEVALAESSVWGLGRVLAGEHDELWGGVIDLPRDDDAVAVLLDVLVSVPADDVIVIRDGVASVARLRPTERVPEGDPVTCRPDGTYLVTGGLGVLGLEVADWLADRGARRLVLAGRRPLPPRHTWQTWHDDGDERIRRIQALEARGVTVRVVSLDIADAARTARVLAALDLPPIRGVVHAAGVLDNRLSRDTDADSLRAVLSPKAGGAWTLHSLFPPGSLDFLALFSSCGYLLGLPGQAAYGAANAFLDALAAHRPDTVSLGWTSWRGMGMARNDIVDRELKARGVTDISRDEAFEAWDHAARLGAAHFPVFGVTEPGDTEQLPILSEVTTARPTASAVVVEDSFTGLPPAQLRERLLVEVGAQIAGEMRLPAAALDVRRSLVEQGLDSVLTMVVRRRLEKRFGQKLPTTLLWHQPSVSAITDHLVTALSTRS